MVISEAYMVNSRMLESGAAGTAAYTQPLFRQSPRSCTGVSSFPSVIHGSVWMPAKMLLKLAADSISCVVMKAGSPIESLTSPVIKVPDVKTLDVIIRHHLTCPGGTVDWSAVLSKTTVSYAYTSVFDLCADGETGQYPRCRPSFPDGAHAAIIDTAKR